MEEITEPMLACTLENIEMVKFPVGCSRKYDGYRITMARQKACTRKFLDVPNLYLRETLPRLFPQGFDGEIMTMRAPTPEEVAAGAEGPVWDDIHTLGGHVRRQKGEPNWRYLVFDWVYERLAEHYADRITRLTSWFQTNPAGCENPLLAKEARARAVLVDYVVANNEDELALIHTRFVAEGYEGTMFRTLTSPYKCGRSTEREGYLLRIKDFVDSEVECIGFMEQMHNDNEMVKNEFGRAKRSHKKEGMVPAGVLGKLLCRTPEGIEFELGSGFTATQKREIWENQTDYKGLFVKIRSQKYGEKNKPRIASFQGFRGPEDM